MGTALMVVVAANHGAGNYRNIETSYRYALRFATLAGAAVGLVVFLCAEPLARLFTWHPESQRLVPELVRYFQITAFYLPVAAAWATASSLFAGLGLGSRSLQLGFLRAFVFTLPLAVAAGLLFDLGLPGIWAAVVLGSLATSALGLWAARTLLRGA
jgi:Na+-driven multidrug efflux pump